MPKKILFDIESLSEIQKGINIMTDAIASTLGPGGRNVIIENPYTGSGILSHDGVSVARHIQLPDKLQNIGAQLIREASEKTVSQVGDGTTTTAILARAIFNRGVEFIKAGHSPVDLKKGIDIAVKQVTEYLKKHAISVKNDWKKVRDIAIISTNNDEKLGTLIAETLEKIGEHGSISIQKGYSDETTVETVNGMYFERGYISPYFINQADKPLCKFQNCKILMYDREIQDMAELLPAIGPLFQKDIPILIIALDVTGSAMSSIVANINRAIQEINKGNKSAHLFRICCVHCPSQLQERKDILKDIECLVGGGLVTEELGKMLKNVTVEEMGEASEVTVSETGTMIVGGKGDPEIIAERIAQIKGAMDAMENKTSPAYTSLEQRLAKMTSGIAIIKVGGVTETEADERRFRVEDAVGATKSALKEGILPGGGLAYYNFNSGESIDTFEGALCVFNSLKEPMMQLVKNCGKDFNVDISGSLETFPGKNHGFNAKTRRIENLMESGVIDSAMVLRCALENAASIAGLLLNSNASITELPENKPNN